MMVCICREKIKKATLTVAVNIGLILTSLLLSACGSTGGNSESVHIESEVITDDASLIAASTEVRNNLCTELSVPTQITKIGDLYFIVDCYHNQVIYNDNLSDPLNSWKVMTSDISLGHTVASDGNVYLVDDTENNRVLVFEYANGVFVNTQVFNEIGTRPHFIVYDEHDKCFFAWSSMTGQMYVFEYTGDGNRLCISKIMSIDELNGVYIRSFTIEDDSIYLVSGNSQIIEARKSDFKIKKVYAVPAQLSGMIQIMPVENGYYITVSTDVNGNQDFATIVYAQNLEGLSDIKYTDIYSYFVGGGTPYYMGEIDGKYYLTEHRLIGHSIWAFDIGDDGIPVNVEALY